MANESGTKENAWTLKTPPLSIHIPQNVIGN